MPRECARVSGCRRRARASVQRLEEATLQPAGLKRRIGAAVRPSSGDTSLIAEWLTPYRLSRHRFCRVEAARQLAVYLSHVGRRRAVPRRRKRRPLSPNLRTRAVPDRGLIAGCPRHVRKSLGSGCCSTRAHRACRRCQWHARGSRLPVSQATSTAMRTSDAAAGVPRRHIRSPISR